MTTKKRYTRATPANVPRSRSRWTRRQRREIRANAEEVRQQQEAYEAMYGDDDYHDYFDDDRCDRCGGDGSIEYLDGGPSVWGEDSPSEVNHLVECPECDGTGGRTP